MIWIELRVGALCQAAIRTLADLGLACAEKSEQHLDDSELLRLRGEILWARNPSAVDAAQENFERALEVANVGAAKSFELRAATSLARLWQFQDKTVEARALLAPVYDGFTEGFDTHDLREAKALLENLG